MEQPLLKLRKVTTLKKPSKLNYVKIKALRPIGTRKIGSSKIKRNSNFSTGGFVKVKSSNLQPLLLDTSSSKLLIVENAECFKCVKLLNSQWSDMWRGTRLLITSCYEKSRQFSLKVWNKIGGFNRRPAKRFSKVE